MSSHGYLRTIDDPNTVITPIDATTRFPEILWDSWDKYREDIFTFRGLIHESKSSSDLLRKIRSNAITASSRMSLLKMFRRCVAPVLDTETTKKIRAVTTDSLIANYGSTFKPIGKLRQQFAELSEDMMRALAALIGEYDTRGHQGYQLTESFFDWFEDAFRGQMTIEGPRRAGRDIELSDVFPEFRGNYPCDFVIKDVKEHVLCVGFARYDSTRGGAQSDDRTGGNSYKVAKAQEFCRETSQCFRLLFVADGPGLAHRDTWAEACELDGAWQDNVRVTTLKLAPSRVTNEWLIGT